MRDNIQLTFCAFLFHWGDNLLPERRKSEAKNGDGWLTQSSRRVALLSAPLPPSAASARSAALVFLSWLLSCVGAESGELWTTVVRSMPSKAVETLFLDTHALAHYSCLSGTAPLSFFVRGFGRHAGHGHGTGGRDGANDGWLSRGITTVRGKGSVGLWPHFVTSNGYGGRQAHWK